MWLSRIYERFARSGSYRIPTDELAVIRRLPAGGKAADSSSPLNPVAHASLRSAPHGCEIHADA